MYKIPHGGGGAVRRGGEALARTVGKDRPLRFSRPSPCGTEMLSPAAGLLPNTRNLFSRICILEKTLPGSPPSPSPQ